MKWLQKCGACQTVRVSCCYMNRTEKSSEFQCSACILLNHFHCCCHLKWLKTAVDRWRHDNEKRQIVNFAFLYMSHGMNVVYKVPIQCFHFMPYIHVWIELSIALTLPPFSFNIQHTLQINLCRTCMNMLRVCDEMSIRHPEQKPAV